MRLLAENNKQGYCPLCGSKLGDAYKVEYEDGEIYRYYDCGKCEATQIEEVYTISAEQYVGSNAWKPYEG